MKLHIIQDNTDDRYIQKLKEMYVNYLKELSPYSSALKNLDIEHTAVNEVNRALNDDSTDCIMICCEEEILGFAFVGQSPNSYCIDDIYIQEFYIKPKFRHIGLGEAAVGRIAKLYDGKDISLFVLEENFPARCFWRVTMIGLGYTDLARIGQIKPPAPERFDESKPKDVVFYYYQKKN